MKFKHAPHFWKLFFLFSLVSLLLSYGVKKFYYSVNIEKNLQREQSTLQTVRELLISRLAHTVDDALSEANKDLYAEFLKSDKHHHLVNQSIESIISKKSGYFQLRVIDLQGNERAKVVSKNGHVTLVSKNELQNKSHTSYVQMGLTKPKGELCISKMNLNKEFGKIEMPLRPALRFVAPIFDPKTSKRLGLFVINYNADELFKILEKIEQRMVGKLEFINGDSFWLYSSNSNKQQQLWGFEYTPIRQNMKMENPILWYKISKQKKAMFHLNSSYYAFDTISRSEFSTCKKQGWKLLSIIDDETLETLLIATNQLFNILYLVFIFLAAIFAKIISHNIKVKNDVAAEQQKNIQSSKLASLGEMAAGVAHEINNPLAVISGYTKQLKKMMQKENPDGEKMELFFKNISDATTKAAKIIKGLKEFSRDTSSDDLEAVSLAQVLEDTHLLYATKLRNNNIKYSHESIAKELMVSCQPVQIGQIIINIVHNAMDAMKDINDKNIEVFIEQTEHTIKINIKNSGSLIPAEIREKIFEPFFTTKPPGDGTGLGLSISKQIAKGHKGDLFLSEDATATTFILELPKVP